MAETVCISLPVHTRPAVIAGQLANFAAFLPGARVVLHVSANARFTPAQLDAVLAGAGCTNAAINPVRLPTGWGDILPAHLANVAWIRRHVPGCTRICLHSSNDMLVRPGLARHLGRGRNFLQRRPLVSGSRWRFTGAALGDPGLQALCRRLGNAAVSGSQVEGSSYEAALLYDAADLIAPALRQAAPVPYPREEVWLPTVAHALIERSGCTAFDDDGAGTGAGTGMPYVFSEVQRFDRVFWRVLDIIDPLIGHRGDARYLPRRALEFLMIRSGFHRIDRRWVDRIAYGGADTLAHSLAPYAWLSDGAGMWRVLDPRGLYGVKRVPRRPDAPLRRYIDSLGAAAPRVRAMPFTAVSPPALLSRPVFEPLTAPSSTSPPVLHAESVAAVSSLPCSLPPAAAARPTCASAPESPAPAVVPAPPPPLRHPRAHPP